MHNYGNLIMRLSSAHLAHVLGLCHLLADDGLLVARVIAGTPAEHGVRPARDVAGASKLDLQQQQQQQQTMRVSACAKDGDKRHADVHMKTMSARTPHNMSTDVAAAAQH
jgi:hypothetical protein